MAKAGRYARYPPRKLPYSTLILALLIGFSFVVLVLLALGIVSLPSGSSSNNSHKVQDLSSMVHASVHRGDKHRNRDGQWVELISWEPRALVYHNFLLLSGYGVVCIFHVSLSMSKK
ncbi:hypothetical protein V2J09_002056 [Rumex salicifolius]